MSPPVSRVSPRGDPFDGGQAPAHKRRDRGRGDGRGISAWRGGGAASRTAPLLFDVLGFGAFRVRGVLALAQGFRVSATER